VKSSFGLVEQKYERPLGVLTKTGGGKKDLLVLHVKIRVSYQKGG